MKIEDWISTKDFSFIGRPFSDQHPECRAVRPSTDAYEGRRTNSGMDFQTQALMPLCLVGTEILLSAQVL